MKCTRLIGQIKANANDSDTGTVRQKGRGCSVIGRIRHLIHETLECASPHAKGHHPAMCRNAGPVAAIDAAGSCTRALPPRH